EGDRVRIPPRTYLSARDRNLGFFARNSCVAQPEEPMLHPIDISQISETHQILFRLGMATMFGGILGVDRDLHHKPAGIRVLAMVGVGACAITMASVAAFSDLKNPTGDGILRTVQGVLSGIGFLGAGVIMRAQGKEEVHGLTTAASIWSVAILGMICGLGEW